MTSDLQRLQLIALLPTGRARAVSAKSLAFQLDTTERHVGQLIAEAIETEGYCIGSLCGERHGYYLVRPGDPEDLAAGVAHSVRRAAATFARARAMQRNYEAMAGSVQTNIFAILDRVSA